MMLEELLGKFMFEALNLTENEPFQIEKVSAKTLINVNRIDVIAKYMYLFFWDKSIPSDLAYEIYKEHINIFSMGRYVEPGSESKKSFDAFLTEFQTLFEDLKANGFDAEKSVVPVGCDGALLNGGHRCAASLYLGLDIDILKLLERPGSFYNYQYFQKRQMKQSSLDFLAYHYSVLTNRNIYLICLWPKAVKENCGEAVDKIIESKTNVVLKKSIRLTWNGLKILMQALYGHQDWVGNAANNYSGIDGKVNACYSDDDTWFYCVEGGTLEETLKLKDEIRDVFNIGKHSVHITDTKEETLNALRLILNENGVNFMNNGNPKAINRQLINIKTELGAESNCVVLHPHFTLGLYGKKMPAISCPYIQTSDVEEDMTYDVRNYLYYDGLKFFAPQLAQKYADKTAASSYDKIIKGNKKTFFSSLMVSLNKGKYIVRRELIILFQKAGIIEQVMKIYNLLRH